MSWLKSNATPLVVGVLVGYFICKSGGLKGATSRVKGLA
jgi:hypothetical protein